MKKTTFIAAFCCLAFMSNAQENGTPNHTTVEVTSSNETSRELVTINEGIEVSYSSSEVSGNTLLNIHFVNTTEETATFTWEVAKEGRVFNSQKAVILKSGKSFDQNAAIEVKGTSNLTDYSIKLTIK